jgi:hypothetical protein
MNVDKFVEARELPSNEKLPQRLQTTNFSVVAAA